VTTTTFNHITRRIEQASFDQTSDLARRIDDERNLTKSERIVLSDKLAARLRAIAGVAATP